MNYHVATFRGETLVFSQAGLKEGAEVLFSGTSIYPEDVVAKWYRQQGKRPKYVSLSQRAFGCWEIDAEV